MKRILYVICSVSLLLGACHNTDSMVDIESAQSSQLDHDDVQDTTLGPAQDTEQDTAQDTAQDTGHKLTDLAGKATMPVNMQERTAPSALNKNAMPYVGRYRIDISCSDPYVGCERGTANFILNLLADGTAHRSIVHMGKIMFNSSHQYYQDRWSYDEINHQIVVQRQNGIKFYYRIQPDLSLKMDLEKIAHADPLNQAFFGGAHPLPQQEYILKKKLNPNESN